MGDVPAELSTEALAMAELRERIAERLASARKYVGGLAWNDALTLDELLRADVATFARSMLISPFWAARVQFLAALKFDELLAQDGEG